ncbi:MAG TPA: hypothetical protein VEB42_02670, partial [Chitinophagaceae bacterium]|nr:hypothetical protein [Chitinophagaceae bacterium]
MSGFLPIVAANQDVISDPFSPSAMTLVRNKHNASCSNDNQWYVNTGSKIITHATNLESYTIPAENCGSMLLDLQPTNIPYNYNDACLEIYQLVVGDLMGKVILIRDIEANV